MHLDQASESMTDAKRPTFTLQPPWTLESLEGLRYGPLSPAIVYCPTSTVPRHTATAHPIATAQPSSPPRREAEPSAAVHLTIEGIALSFMFCFHCNEEHQGFVTASRALKGPGHASPYPQSRRIVGAIVSTFERPRRHTVHDTLPSPADRHL